MFDPLEPRRLFAAAPVNVNGTAGNDVITVAQGSTAYVITVNGTPQQHALADVSAINVFASDGADTVVFDASLTLGAYCDLGIGNDKFVGGSGPDTVLGAAGKDQIYGGLGNDRLNGAGGNDKVIGEAGADRLYGGDGADYIDGGSSGDRMYPGEGIDTALGQSGNDFFFAVDSTRDELYGGSGDDTAHSDAEDVRGAVEFFTLT
jgi:Ca2+-binding RTX toxin-like protein